MNKLSALLALIVCILSFLYLSERREAEALRAALLFHREKPEQRGAVVEEVPTAVATQVTQQTIDALPPVQGDSQAEPTANLGDVSGRETYMIESRISSLGRFFPLSEDQRERLRIKYRNEFARRRGVDVPEPETLEAIVGDENATFYRQQVQRSFDRAAEQERDREVYYLTRKLNLTAAQEQSMREAMVQTDLVVQGILAQEFDATRRGPGVRMQRMIRANELEAKELAERARSILDPEQYQAYLQEQNDSAAQEMGMWH